MSLIERYLAAVSAQLKPAEREDVIAELRDDLMSRIEARQEALGRDLTDDEIETVLREVGHPLAVAARYGAGPQQLIGPQLFPWWLFAMKVGLAAMVLMSIIGLISRMAGGMDFSQALSQALRGLFDGGLTLVGIVTAVGFIWERSGGKPDFISNWRVRDLGLFELGRLSTDGLSSAMQAAGVSKTAEKPTSSRMSPLARALASATAAAVILLWWLGVIPLGAASWDEMQVIVGGVDFTQAAQATVNALWLPVVLYLAWRVSFDLYRAIRPRDVRGTALGDMALAIVRSVGAVWILIWSPLGLQLGSNTLLGVVEHLRSLFHGHWAIENVVIVILISTVFQAIAQFLVSLTRLVTGRDRRLDQA